MRFDVQSTSNLQARVSLCSRPDGCAVYSLKWLVSVAGGPLSWRPPPGGGPTCTHAESTTSRSTYLANWPLPPQTTFSQ